LLFVAQTFKQGCFLGREVMGGSWKDDDLFGSGASDTSDAAEPAGKGETGFDPAEFGGGTGAEPVGVETVISSDVDHLEPLEAVPGGEADVAAVEQEVPPAEVDGHVVDQEVRPVVADVPVADKVQEGNEMESTRDSQGKVAGLTYSRYYTRADIDVFDTVVWEKRDAQIKAQDKSVVFSQTGMDFPAFFSLTASNVIASKYFRGSLGQADRESSFKDMITRVVETISGWAVKGGYFADATTVREFRDELSWLVLHQHGSFNSPVWFNVGVEDHPQCSACFINSVEDTMESILGLAVTEGMLFKYGSGTGTNLSTIRSSKERLKGGGVPSGPVSFMRGYDAFAGVIKSGGKTRRAAKMVVLNADHPDIVDFIECKVREEDKALALIAGGYDGSFGGEAYESVFFQNANNSVRVTDEFMQAVLNGGMWQTRAITDGHVVETMKASDIMDRICKAAHRCGDPGMQFDTIVNDWHTCLASGRINASNPCSEFMFLDNSACNLASLNLMRFVGEDGRFDSDGFRHAVRTFIIAQEVIISNAKYPTEPIGRNSEDYRPLGLGYANLGGLLMSWGLAYDSDAGRACAAAISALMTGESYVASAQLAATVGPFKHYEKNAQPMTRVIRKHRAALETVDERYVPRGIMAAARDSWDKAVELGLHHGFRNAQVTLLAPTGTIGFMMDCDTTGIEPELAIVKYKNLVGGGQIKMVNRTVPAALARLGYTEAQVNAMVEYVDRNDTIEGAPGLKSEHLPVFDCAFKPFNGKRSISVDGHIHMMGAVQPFLSGAISKTVNLPADSTVEDVRQAYVDSWKYGLKAVAIYRDGSKGTQPVMTSREKEAEKPAAIVTNVPARTRLPDERASITHKFTIAGLDGYITVGMHDDGKPGEIFITMAKQGSVIRGLMDSFATSVSIALQYGVPLEVLVAKFAHVRFEPNGFSSNPAIGYAKSIVDYVFRWLDLKFLKNQPGVRKIEPPIDLEAMATDEYPADGELQNDLFQGQDDAPPCSECGFVMVRNGKCYKCLNCGSTSGCS